VVAKIFSVGCQFRS